MRKRFRNPDRYRIGKSSLVPYISNESWKERHQRRKRHALENKGKVEVWCQKHRWRMYINNEGHHWLFYTNEGKQVEWWPSSGKLVIGKQYTKAFHVHDYKQLLEEVFRYFPE